MLSSLTKFSLGVITGILATNRYNSIDKQTFTPYINKGYGYYNKYFTNKNQQNFLGKYISEINSYDYDEYEIFMDKIKKKNGVIMV